MHTNITNQYGRISLLLLLIYIYKKVITDLITGQVGKKK